MNDGQFHTKCEIDKYVRYLNSWTLIIINTDDTGMCLMNTHINALISQLAANLEHDKLYVLYMLKWTLYLHIMELKSTVIVKLNLIKDSNLTYFMLHSRYKSLYYGFLVTRIWTSLWCTKILFLKYCIVLYFFKYCIVLYLGFWDIWSGQESWRNWYLTPVVNFGEVWRAQLAKSTLLTTVPVPLGSFQIF